MGYSMRTKRYHYVEWFYWDNENKAAEELAGKELYDLLTDPQENNNIAVLPKHEAVMSRLSKQLKAGWRGALPKQ